MDNGSNGTLGRRGLKAMAGMRRQRSLEWRQERGYSSSEEEIATRPVDSHVFASLLAQAQQEYSSKFTIMFTPQKNCISNAFEITSVGTIYLYIKVPNQGGLSS